MGYSWLITARCDYPCYQHAESSMGREAVGGVYNNPFLGCLLFCSALIVAWWWKPSKYKHENVYIRARLKPGWVWWVFYFTFECCEFFTRPNYQFFPPLFDETLDASCKEGFSFFMSLSLSRLTVERDCTFPIAPMKKMLRVRFVL